MKKIICLLVICFTLTGCVSGNNVPTEKTDYSIILNRGSIFVYIYLKTKTQTCGICQVNMV